MVNEIKNLQDFTEALGDDKTGIVVIDFFGDWCPPCKMIAPFYAQLAEKYPNIAFHKINCDNPNVKDIVDTCEIRSLPTFCFFSGGIYIDRVIGANKQTLEDIIKQLNTTTKFDDVPEIEIEEKSN